MTFRVNLDGHAHELNGAVLPPSAVLGNIGRDGVVEVTTTEPLPPDRALWRCPNTVLTRHTGGGYADEWVDKARFRMLENLGGKGSYDEGRMWPANRTLEPGPSGYSDLAVLPGGTICCFYECGRLGGSNTRNAVLTFTRFNLVWIANGKDRP